MEIGSSAGLNLLWDRYAYDYGNGRAYGNPSSPVRIPCELRSIHVPPLPEHFPQIVQRTGVDLNPLDMREPDDRLWLEALIWPEHIERAERLRAAIEVLVQQPPALVEGNVLDLLPQLLSGTSASSTLCVFHSFTINQFSPRQCEHLSSLLAAHSEANPLFRVSIEWLGTEQPLLRLAFYQAGAAREEVLACCDSHGRWLEWFGKG